MAHYDNVKNRIKSIVNISQEAYSLVGIDLLRNAQSYIMQQLSSDNDLLTEYTNLIQSDVPDNTEYSDLSEDERKLWHYEMATAYLVLSELYSSLKKISKDNVFLDRLSLGTGDLDPVDYKTIMQAGEEAIDKAGEHLNIATGGYVSGTGLEVIVI